MKDFQLLGRGETAVSAKSYQEIVQNRFMWRQTGLTSLNDTSIQCGSPRKPLRAGQIGTRYKHARHI